MISAMAARDGSVILDDTHALSMRSMRVSGIGV